MGRVSTLVDKLLVGYVIVNGLVPLVVVVVRAVVEDVVPTVVVTVITEEVVVGIDVVTVT